MTQAVDDLNAAVTRMGAAVDVAVADIKSLADQIAAAQATNDSAAIEAAVTQLNASADALSAAVNPPPV